MFSLPAENHLMLWQHQSQLTRRRDLKATVAKVQGAGPPVYTTMCGGYTTAIQYKSTHQLCASQGAVENGDSDCRGWSTELCPTILLLIRWWPVEEYECALGRCWQGDCWRRVSGHLQLLVVGETRRAYTTT